MAYRCEICEKKSNVGHAVSHAKNRTRKVSKPNLHTHHLVTESGKIKMLVCTKCKRMIKGK